MSYHGVFRRYRRSEPEDYDVPTCPVCGEDCTVYYKKFGEIIGCDECIDNEDAWEVMVDNETV